MKSERNRSQLGGRTSFSHVIVKFNISDSILNSIVFTQFYIF